MRQTGYTISTSKPFLRKVDHNEMPWIDHKAYEESQELIIKAIRSARGKLGKCYKPKEKDELRKKISLLKNIEASLQLALETY